MWLFLCPLEAIVSSCRKFGHIGSGCHIGFLLFNFNRFAILCKTAAETFVQLVRHAEGGQIGHIGQTT